MSSLADVLDNTTTATPSPDQPAATTTAADQPPVKDAATAPDQPATSASPAAPASPPKEEMTDKEKALLKAAMEERNKRQALEKELAKHKPAEDKQLTFWDDPEGHLNKAQQETRNLLIQNKLDTTEVMARHRYKDFDDHVKTFAELVKSNPTLSQQWLASVDPAEFAYRTGKNYKELQDAGNVDKMREKIEKEMRLKIEAEYKAKEEARKKEIENLPGSLSNVAGSNPTKAAWGGPASLDSILKS